MYPQVPKALDPPFTHNVPLPAARMQLIRRTSCMMKSRSLSIFFRGNECISALTILSNIRFASFMESADPRRNSILLIPRPAAAMAVLRAWLDWTPPHVMMVSQHCRRASAMRNSSFLILLPVVAAPVKSSRLIKTLAPGLFAAMR